MQKSKNHKVILTFLFWAAISKLLIRSWHNGIAQLPVISGIHAKVLWSGLSTIGLLRSIKFGGFDLAHPKYIAGW